MGGRIEGLGSRKNIGLQCKIDKLLNEEVKLSGN